MLALTDFPWTETNLSFQSMWGGGPANLWENCCVKGEWLVQMYIQQSKEKVGTFGRVSWQFVP